MSRGNEDRWQRCLPNVAPSGDIGGDIQVSEAFGARWQRRLADGNTGMVTRSYYAAAGVPTDAEASYLECQTEYLVCSDPTDPGGTEIWAEYVYANVRGSSGRRNGKDARRAAEAAPEPTDHEWRTYAPDWTTK